MLVVSLQAIQSRCFNQRIASAAGHHTGQRTSLPSADSDSKHHHQELKLNNKMELRVITALLLSAMITVATTAGPDPADPDQETEKEKDLREQLERVRRLLESIEKDNALLKKTNKVLKDALDEEMRARESAAQAFQDAMMDMRTMSEQMEKARKMKSPRSSSALICSEDENGREICHKD